jgi:hypothetical protein
MEPAQDCIYLAGVDISSVESLGSVMREYRWGKKVSELLWLLQIQMWVGLLAEEWGGSGRPRDSAYGKNPILFFPIPWPIHPSSFLPLYVMAAHAWKCFVSSVVLQFYYYYLDQLWTLYVIRDTQSVRWWIERLLGICSIELTELHFILCNAKG